MQWVQKGGQARGLTLWARSAEGHPGDWKEKKDGSPVISWVHAFLEVIRTSARMAIWGVQRYWGPWYSGSHDPTMVSDQQNQWAGKDQALE